MPEPRPFDLEWIRGVTAVAPLESPAEREDLRAWMEDLGSMTSDEAAAYRSELEELEFATAVDGP